jgi:hypothetical protein
VEAAADGQRHDHHEYHQADEVEQYYAPVFGAIDAALETEEKIPVHRSTSGRRE